MEYPAVLISAPTFDGKNYCQWDWIEQLSQLTYPNFKVFLSDNSVTDEFSKKINEYGIECVWCDPKGKGNIKAMADSHEQCRLKAISIGAEYLLHLETDLFFNDKSIIEKLVLRRKKVVGCLYHINHGVNSYLCLIERKQMHEYELPTTHLLQNGADLAFVDGNCKKISHCGLGATLIHKSVFEKVQFRADANERFHPDTNFAIDCYYNGVDIYVDTSILCQHRNQQWMHL
jgi:predicted peroxiredoxin